MVQTTCLHCPSLTSLFAGMEAILNSLVSLSLLDLFKNALMLQFPALCPCTFSGMHTGFVSLVLFAVRMPVCSDLSCVRLSYLSLCVLNCFNTSAKTQSHYVLPASVQSETVLEREV